MRTLDDPSLNQSFGNEPRQDEMTHDNTITIITNNYLKNIREDLIEEEAMNTPHHDNEIIYINAEVNGILSKIMRDTGSKVSLIDSTELERIQRCI